MSPTIYQQAQKQRYRITLNIEALGDFDPDQIDWAKLFKLEGSEYCDAYIEHLSDDNYVWWGLLTEASKVSQ